MKIVHTADWHIGKSLNDYSLLDDQKYYFEQFTKRLEELKPDILIVAGDIYDRSMPPSSAVQLLDEILCKIVIELKIKTLIIAGNHDSKTRLSFGNKLLSSSGLFMAGEINEALSPIKIESINFYLLPYLEPHNIKKYYENVQIKTQQQAIEIYTSKTIENLDKNAVNILVAHGLFGAKIEAEVGGAEMVDISIFKDFDYVALGHLHSSRKVGFEHARYAGSPLKYSVKEACQEKSFTVLEFNNKADLSFTTEKIQPLHDLKVLEGDFEFLCNAENANNEILEDYIFVSLTDKSFVLDAVSRLKAIYKNIIGLKYINLENDDNSTIISSKNSKTLTTKELFSEFYLNVTDKEIPDNERKYIDEL